MQITNNLFRCFIFVVIFSSGVVCSIGQENSSDLKNKRITIKMENAPFGDVLDYLINQYDVAIGFEESALDTDHNDFDFDTNLPFTRNKELVSSDGSIRISVTAKKVYISRKK